MVKQEFMIILFYNTMFNQKESELYKKIQDLEYELGRLKKKKYGLVWEDKPEKFDKESQNALPVLKDKGSKFKDIITDTEDDFNILIEGDNYHSLSVLSYTHKGKIDVIYIDPPYNRGGDFRYNDSYIDREDPYRHSKWLSFMKKRLSIAKDLLTNEGTMFISIDDSEQAQLKLLCQDIFGEDNVENYIWQLGDFTESSFTKTASNTVRFEHEYLIACYKSCKRLGRYEEYRFGEREDFGNPDNDSRGDWMSGNISRNGIKSTSGSKYFTITTPTGKKYTRNWTVSEEEFEELVKDNRIYFSKNGDGVPRIKIFKNEPSKTIQSSVFSGLKTSITGKNQLKKIFQGKEVFDFPKPVDLIKRIIEISTTKNSLILDFMAGSGTTGQAVLELNENRGLNHKFILCTNNENNICEQVTFNRIKSIINGYVSDENEAIKGIVGNLKYLKTDFVKLDKVNDNLRRKIVDRSTEVLCLKENTFNLYKDLYSIMKANIFENKEKYTAILFDTFYFEEFVDELKKLKDKSVSIYVFSHTNTFSREEFGDLNLDFTVEAIPEKILETYKKTFNF